MPITILLYYYYYIFNKIISLLVNYLYCNTITIFLKLFNDYTYFFFNFLF